MEIDILSKCRICLGEHVDMVSLFECKDSVLLCDNIERCGGVQVSEGDGGPTQMCYVCLQELSEALKFREKCESADRQIKSTLQSHSKVSHASTNSEKSETSNCTNDLKIKEEVNYDNDSHFDNFESSLNFKDEYLDDLKIEYGNEEDHKSESSECKKLRRTSKSCKAKSFLQEVPYCEDSLVVSKAKRKKIRKAHVERLRKEAPVPKKRGRRPKLPNEIVVDSKDFLIKTIKGEFQCDVCKKVFLGSKTYNNHKKGHLITRDYKCDICGKEFKYKDNLKVHFMIHTGERPFHCDLCDKSFSKKDNLAVHRKRHLKERNYSCDQCGSSYYTSYELKTHTRVHTGEKPHVCPLCGKSFTAKNNLYIHQRSHTGEKPHPCNVCGKQFNSKNILAIHSRIHTGEKPYICSVCGKRFAANKLAVHMRTHTGEKPHACPLCGKRFSATNVLVIHMRRHTGEKPYHCKICGQSYGHTQSLNKHLRKHHKVVTNGLQVQMQEIGDEHRTLLEEKDLPEITAISPQLAHHDDIDECPTLVVSNLLI